MPASLPKYLSTIVPAATPAAIAAVPIRIMRVEFVGGSANSTFELKNAATDTGTVLIYGAALIGTTMPPFDYEAVGGVPFSVACYAKPAGTAAVLRVWWELLQNQAAFA